MSLPLPNRLSDLLFLHTKPRQTKFYFILASLGLNKNSSIDIRKETGDQLIKCIAVVEFNIYFSERMEPRKG